MCMPLHHSLGPATWQLSPRQELACSTLSSSLATAKGACCWKKARYAFTFSLKASLLRRTSMASAVWKGASSSRRLQWRNNEIA